MSESTEWLVGERLSGKTTVLMDWISRGRLLQQGVWSRMLVVVSQQRMTSLIHNYTGLSDYLVEQGLTDGLLGVMATPHELERTVRESGVEFAVDDAEQVLSKLLGAPVVALSGTGGVSETPQVAVSTRRHRQLTRGGL